MKSPLLRFLAAAGLILAALIAYGFFLEWQVRYWDRKIDELCAAEGGKNVGVKVYERVMAPEHYLPKRQADGAYEENARVRVPGMKPQPYAKPVSEEPIVHGMIEIQVIRESWPRVSKYSARYVSVGDGRVLGEVITYLRAYGGIPVPGFHEGHQCPPMRDGYDLGKAIFINHPLNQQ